MVASNRVTAGEWVQPAIGYLAVALICLISGNFLRDGAYYPVSLFSNKEQLLYFLLLIPTFLCRVMMYEKRSETNRTNVDDDWRKNSIQVPLIALIIALLVYCSMATIEGSGTDWKKLGLAIVAAVPIVLQTVVSRLKWREDQSHDFDFRYYIFFPALSTCIMSFIAGWTHLESTYYDMILLVTGLIISYYGLSIVVPKMPESLWKAVDYLVMGVFSVLFIWTYLREIPAQLDNPMVKKGGENRYLVLVAASMMTLMMGLTETWWFVHDNENIGKFNPDIHAFYRRRLHLFSIFLPIFLPLMIFDRHVNALFYSIILYSISLSVIWLIIKQVKINGVVLIQRRGWKGIKLCFGMILPFFFAMALTPNHIIRNLHFPFQDSSIQTFSLVTLFFSFLGGAAIFFSKDRRSTTRTLAYILALCYIVLPSFINLIIKTNFSPDTIGKINLLQGYGVIAGIVFLVGKFDDDQFFEFRINENSSMKNNTSITSQILLFIETGRIIPSLCSGVFAFLVLYLHNHKFCLSFFKVLPIVLVTMLAFVFNDIFDLEKDKQAGKLRPITTGKLPVRKAFFFAKIIGLFLVFYDLVFNGFYSFLVILVCLAGVYYYSLFSRRLPLLKVLYTAIICCAPLIYGQVLIGQTFVPIKMLPIIIYVIGREIWLDKIDMNGDIAANLRTIPFYLGSGASMLLGFALMIVSLAVLVLMANTMLSTGFAWTALITFLLCIFIAYRREEVSVHISRFVMFTGFASMAFIV